MVETEGAAVEESGGTITSDGMEAKSASGTEVVFGEDCCSDDALTDEQGSEIF
ncbi:hypothetical protein CCACVL1_14658 [Corchorus capsularis]|uniref:Uncharacterized protein n=1 Tax=Corchorus capsularis TaxID=210143 RepID=A0A1R3I695_COCAP|nr:hypothetical protein CCACVL1_14658 [Corchorus capsularis]